MCLIPPNRLLWLGCLLLLVSGCGYLRSGTWDDDPDNWGRAFRSIKPDDVVVVHSRYWRTPHFTYEAGYVFEIAPNRALRQQLFTENKLQELGAGAVADARDACGRECPPWFAPKPAEQYEVWGYADDPMTNFRVLIDRESGTMFLSDYQL